MTDREKRRLDELQRLLRSDREPPPERIAMLRAQADERRRRGPAPQPEGAIARRRLLLGGAAASIGALAGAGGFALTDEDPVAGPPTETVAVEVGDGGVTASASLINHTWGTEYVLTADGLTAGRKYRVFFDTADGERLSAGSFIGVEKGLVCRMTASVLRKDLRRIEVLAGLDDMVVTTRLT